MTRYIVRCYINSIQSSVSRHSEIESAINIAQEFLKNGVLAWPECRLNVDIRTERVQ